MSDYYYRDYVDKDNPDAPGIYLAEASGGQWEDKWDSILCAAVTKQEIIDFIEKKLEHHKEINKLSIDQDEFCDIEQDYENHLIDTMYPGSDYDDLSNEQWDEIYKFTDCDIETYAQNLFGYITEHKDKKYNLEQIQSSIIKSDSWYEVPMYSIIKVPMLSSPENIIKMFGNGTEKLG